MVTFLCLYERDCCFLCVHGVVVCVCLLLHVFVVAFVNYLFACLFWCLLLCLYACACCLWLFVCVLGVVHVFFLGGEVSLACLLVCLVSLWVFVRM